MQQAEANIRSCRSDMHASPKAASHTSRRPRRPSDQGRHSTPQRNTAEAKPEPPLRHPRQPQGRASPSRRRTRRHQPPAHSTGPSGRWNIQSEAPRGKRHNSATLARSHKRSGVSPGKPGWRSEITTTTTPSRRTRHQRASPSSVQAGNLDKAFAW